MKRTLLILALVFVAMTSSAQQRLVYQSYMLGSDSGDTTFREVKRYKNQLRINDIQEFKGKLIDGISTDFTYVDYDADSAYYQMNYQDGESFFYAYPLKTNDVIFEESNGTFLFFSFAIMEYIRHAATGNSNIAASRSIDDSIAFS